MIFLLKMINADSSDNSNDFEDLSTSYYFTGKYISELMELIKKYEHIEDIFNLCKTSQEQGMVYEKIWSLCLKCGLGNHCGFDYDNVLHYTGDANIGNLKITSVMKYSKQTL